MPTGAADFAEWYGTSDPTRQGVFAGLVLQLDAAKGVYSYSTATYWPADGLRGGVMANGHSQYFTTAFKVRLRSCMVLLL